MSDRIPPIGLSNNSTADNYINLNHESRISRLEEKIDNTNQKLKEDYRRANDSYKELSSKIDDIKERLSKLEFSKVQFWAFICGASTVGGLVVSLIGWIISLFFK